VSAEVERALRSTCVIDVPDYPEPGILFKDITPLLADHDAFSAVVTALASAGRDDDGNVIVDKVVGMEARGFILAAPVALALGAGFVPVRKAGKLPRATHAVSYALEYGEATLEIHQDAIAPGDRVLLVDDVLATGGTAAATASWSSPAEEWRRRSRSSSSSRSCPGATRWPDFRSRRSGASDPPQTHEDPESSTCDV
jgi:adenine phosphoribosyltransferase